MKGSEIWRNDCCRVGKGRGRWAKGRFLITRCVAGPEPWWIPDILPVGKGSIVLRFIGLLETRASFQDGVAKKARLWFALSAWQTDAF